MRKAMWVGGDITGIGKIPMLGVTKKVKPSEPIEPDPFTPLFANNEQGFFYDPNDLSTLYQDAAGKNGVNASGKPLGLVLDKSNGLAVGPELVDLSKWVARSNTTIKVTGNKVRISAIADGSFGADLNYTSPTISGKRYKILFNLVKSNLTSSIYARFTTTGSASIYDAGSHSLVQLSTGADSAAIATVSGKAGDYVEVELSVVEVLGNHAYQSTSAARPILRDAPKRIDFDAVDDKLITNLPAQLTGCTVVRSVPNVGTQILTGQTIPATYSDNTDHCGLIVINRALTPSETSAITTEFNKRAGV